MIGVGLYEQMKLPEALREFMEKKEKKTLEMKPLAAFSYFNDDDKTHLVK